MTAVDAGRARTGRSRAAAARGADWYRRVARAQPSMATRITVCVVAGISILLLIAIAFNGKWKPRFSASPPSLRLASGMRRVRRLVNRASAIVGATRAKFFSKPKEESILPK